MKKLFPFLLLLFAPSAFAQVGSGCPSSTVFGNAACNLAAGSWVHIPDTSMTGWNHGDILRPIALRSVTEFSDKGVYNPITNSLMWLGNSHPDSGNPGPCDSMLFVKYDIAGNLWSQLAIPCPAIQSGGHTYQDLTIDPATGNFFERVYNSVKIGEFAQATQVWTNPTNWEPTCTAGGSCSEGGLAWFPERNSLIMDDATGGVFECVFGGSNSNGTVCATWKQLACNQFTCTGIPRFNQMGLEDVLGIYSPLCHCVILGGGGGSTFIVAYQQDGTFRTLNAAPFALDIASANPNGQNWAVDPASGRFVVVNRDCHIWNYDPQTDIWKDTGSLSPACPTQETGVANQDPYSIPLYNVIAYVYENSAGGAGSVWLYKNMSVNDGDFIQRCEATGVILCNGFDAPADIAGVYGNLQGTIPNPSANGPVLDTIQFASNGSSMKFSWPANSTADKAGSFFTGAPAYHAGADRFAFFQARFDSGGLAPTNGNGFKIMIHGQPDGAGCTPSVTTNCATSCSKDEIDFVSKDAGGFGYPIIYTTCGVFNGLEYQIPPLPATNATNVQFSCGGAQSDCTFENSRPSPWCLHSQNGANRFPPNGNCEPWLPNQWVAYQVEINTLGATFQTSPCGYNGVILRAWQATNGSAWQPIINFGPFLLPISGTCTDAGFGKTWFLPYDTNATNAGPGNMWIDEFIFSSVMVNAPLAVPALTGTPAISFQPTSLTFAPQLINTVSSFQTVTITNTGTATMTLSSITTVAPFSKGTSTCGATLIPTASCTVAVSFGSQVAGAFSGSLVVTDDAPGSPQSVPLLGTSVVAASKGSFAMLNGTLLLSGGIAP